MSGGLAYPDRIQLVDLTGGGGSTGADDVWVPDPGGETATWESPAFVDDRGRGLQRDQAGIPTATSDAVAFCYLTLPANVAVDATVRITYKGGATEDATVMKVNRAENSLDLRHV